MKASRDKLLLLLIFSFVQLALLLWVGIYTKEEAIKYIGEAGYFQQYLHFSEPKYLFYSSYIFLHVLSHAIGAGIVGVYILQLIVNAIATLCFHSLVVNLTAKKTIAFLATLLLVLCIPYQKWTVYLFTESIFFSLLIIYFYILFQKREESSTRIILAAILLLLIILARPTGILIIPPTLLLIARYLYKHKHFIPLTIACVAGVLAFVVITNLAMQGQGEFDFLKPFREEHIICGYPQKTSTGNTNTSANTLQGLMIYIFQNPRQFGVLAIERIIAFFGMIRPYFSARHNLFLGAFFYPIYLFALAGIPTMYRVSKRFAFFSAMVISVFMISVMVTCDDWHNRFIMPVMPVIFVFAAAGMDKLYELFSKKKRRQTS